MRVYTKGDKKYLSVTSIVDLMFGFDKGGFDLWASKNHLSSEWITKHSSDIGTLYHSYFENKYHGISDWANIIPDETAQRYVDAVEDFYKQGWEITDSEREVFCEEYGYAGRFDLVIKNKSLGIKEAIGDIKTWGAWNKKKYKKDQKKLEKFNKANALIQIGIDTAKAISSLVAASQSNPFNGVTAGAAGIAQFASGIIQIVTNIAKAKQILTSGGTPSAGGGGGAAESSGSGANVAQQVPQAAQLFGSANTGNVMSAGGTTSGGSMSVTAIVSETQITNVQNKITKINKNAEL
jgi:hypothetical protein